MVYPSNDGHGFTSGNILSRYTDCMLSTGIKDAYGREIYIGDIIDVHIPNSNMAEGVGGTTTLGPFEVKFEYEDFGTNLVLYPMNECAQSGVKYQVVGNIYETPHLIE